jgi:hypothetical protein
MITSALDQIRSNAAVEGHKVVAFHDVTIHMNVTCNNVKTTSMGEY